MALEPQLALNIGPQIAIPIGFGIIGTLVTSTWFVSRKVTKFEVKQNQHEKELTELRQLPSFMSAIKESMARFEGRFQGGIRRCLECEGVG